MRQQVLYQIFKFSSTFICENNLDIKNYTKRQAIQDGALVSIGDNILLDRIRAYRGDNRNYKEIFNDVQKYREMLRRCKKEGKNKEARILNQFLIDNLFIKDVLVVKADKKAEYKKLAKNGFYVNGIKYVRFSAGAGQIRRNTSLFINEELYEPMYKTLMCGLDVKVKEMNLAKLSAYFALTTSSVMWVDTPRVCVIKDFDTTIPNQKVDWIYKDENGEGHVEERIMDITLNSADGQGLVDPTWSGHWARNMGLDYIPSSFVVRSAFIKGNLVPFDFKEYARQNGITRIYDAWGTGHDIEDIDVLLSTSQFKTSKYYGSWDEYLSYAEKGGIKWGVARYNRKYDDEFTLVNYQYLQVLAINKDEIKKMIHPTVDWIQKVCTGDELYALLYSLGGFGAEDTYNDAYGRAQSLTMKAVVKNSDFLKDSFVQRKIYRNIVETINQAKIGKIWVKGNYQFCISDPIAQCRSALGLDPNGEIPADHVYSNFWNERGVTGMLDLCRSPMIDLHEHNPSKLYRSEEADYWYQYIKSGVIYSIYDTAVCRQEDSDYDGDLILSTNNFYFIKGSNKSNSNVIMYDKPSAPSHKIKYGNFIATDIRGFGTAVGQFSNIATIIETMKALFTKPDQQSQREELQLRKKLLREIVGAEIDKIARDGWFVKLETA